MLSIILGYLAGSVPFAFLLARRRGIDVRFAGSGNVGAANVMRTTGTGRAVAVMALDVAKGAAAVLILFRHRANLKRLYTGTERKMGMPA
jgi:glycerol-3-phosphate acyltransferase PlsY